MERWKRTPFSVTKTGVHHRHFYWPSPQISKQRFQRVPVKGCYCFTKKHAHDSSKSTSIEAHRNTDLCFQFPKYRPVRCIKLYFYYIRPMCKAVNERNYWLIEMNIKKTLLPSALSFLGLNLVEKAVLRYAGLYKSALRNKQLIIFHADNLKGKSIVETLKTSAFSFIIVDLVNKGILLFLITTGA